MNFKNIITLVKTAEEKAYKKVSHIIFFWISMLFTISLFYQFSSEPYMKAVWVSFAVGLELLKTYLIRIIKTKFEKSKWYINVAMMFVYLVIAIISAICSYGKVKTSLAEQEFKANTNIVVMETASKNIDTINGLSQALILSAQSSAEEQVKMSSMKEAYHSGQAKMSNQVDKTVEGVKELIALSSEIAEKTAEIKDSKDSVAMDVFTLIGEDFGTSGKKTLFWIFIVLIFMLEIAIFMTSDPFIYTNEDILGEKEVDIALKYVDHLRKPNSLSLNSDKKISEDSGISESECKRYRVLLSEDLKWRNRFLIEKKNRTWKANFNSASIKKVVREYFEGENL